MWNTEVFGFEFFYLFYHFFLYSFFGWIYESCLVSFQKHKWVNRGFLNGPVIPIYGAGATSIMMVLDPVKNNYVLVFFGGMLVASVLEFVTSWVMEKLFHAKWWDYSNSKFNLQGRICLGVSLFWGLLSLTMEAVFKPGMDNLIARIPRPLGEYAGYLIFAVFSADLIVTVVSTVQLDRKLAELARLRDEFMANLENSRLVKEGGKLLNAKWDEWQAEWKARTAGLQYTELVASFRTRLEELMAWREDQEDREENSALHEFKEDLDEKVRRFISSYQGKLNQASLVQRRLLNAFPNLKAKGREDALHDFQEKLHKRGKELDEGTEGSAGKDEEKNG